MRCGRKVLGGLLAASALLLCGCSSPPPIPLPPPPRGAELQLLLSYAASTGLSNAEYTRLNVTVKRIVPDAKWVGIMTGCLQARGQAGTTLYIEGNVELLPLPSGVPQPASDALEACVLQYPKKSFVDTLRSTAQWDYEYDYLAGSLTGCLRSQGFAVKELLPRQAYVQSGIQQQHPLGPYDGLGIDLTSARGKLLLQECPPNAPGF